MRKIDKLKNIQRANILNENLYMLNKNPLFLIENVLKIDDDDFQNENLVSKWLFESMLEHGVGLDNLITENKNWVDDKELMTESLIGAGIGVLLATGKFVDVMSSLFKKLRNKMVQWGWLGKDAKTWDKTKGEQFGDWWEKNIIDRIFKSAAKFLLGIVAIGVTVFSAVNTKKSTDYYGQIVTQSNIDDLAAILFYGTITALSLTAVFGGISELLHHGQIWAAIADQIATGVKFYEILLLVLAFFFVTYIDVYKPFKSNLTHFAHALGECLEGSGFMKTIKALKDSANDKKQTVVACVNNNMHVKHDEQGSKDTHQAAA